MVLPMPCSKTPPLFSERPPLRVVLQLKSFPDAGRDDAATMLTREQRTELIERLCDLCASCLVLLGRVYWDDADP